MRKRRPALTVRRKVKRAEKDIAASGILRGEMLFGIPTGEEKPTNAKAESESTGELMQFSDKAESVADDLIRGARRELKGGTRGTCPRRLVRETR